MCGRLSVVECAQGSGLKSDGWFPQSAVEQVPAGVWERQGGWAGHRWETETHWWSHFCEYWQFATRSAFVSVCRSAAQLLVGCTICKIESDGSVYQETAVFSSGFGFARTLGFQLVFSFYCAMANFPKKLQFIYWTVWFQTWVTGLTDGHIHVFVCSTVIQLATAW